MANINKKTLHIFLIILHSCVADRDFTPVFILDYEHVLTNIKVEPNPFLKVKSSDFSAMIEEAVKRSKAVIIFVEESFCFEDISTKDIHGSPFYHLGQGLKESKVKFLPAVSQPFKTLKTQLPPHAANVFLLSDSTSKLKIYDSRFTHFYIYFRDNLNESRASALRRHDLLIKEVYFVVRQIAAGAIVAFYTGKLNPIVTEKINFLPVKTHRTSYHPGVTIYSSGAMFKFIGVYTVTGTRRSTFSQIPLVAEETWQEQSLTTRMAYSDFELEFSFQLKHDRWIVENVALLEWGEEVGRTSLGVGAPWNWSYTCSEPLVIVNLRDGSAVTISHYQIQPFSYKRFLFEREGNASGASFGPPVNCGPYFNAQILAGLAVTFLCLGILVYGVTSMYNVHANSRYDDPQGKPLVIVAEGGGGH